MVQYSDSSDGEDDREKRVNKESKVLTKPLPQAMIRSKYNGIWTFI